MLEAESDRKKALARQLAGLDDVARVASLDTARLTKLLRVGAADVKALLGESVPQARQMLRKVLVGRLPLLAVVTPAGFEPAISTLKGSRPRPG